MGDIRVLVFGSTGTGKTSLCNELSGLEMPTSNSARGVTFESYTYKPFRYKNHNIFLTDTIGLNESSSGTVNPNDAIQSIIKLLKESKDGYNLLIHVMKAPRITDSIVKNYDLFVNTLTQNKIPAILVVTGCESEDPMNNWVEKNKHEFKKDQMNYRAIVATCFAKGGVLESGYKELRNISTQEVIESLLENSLSSPVKIYSNWSEFGLILKKFWNKACEFFEWNDLRLGVNDGVGKLLSKLNVSESVIELFTRKDFDLKELGIKTLMIGLGVALR